MSDLILIFKVAPNEEALKLKVLQYMYKKKKSSGIADSLRVREIKRKRETELRESERERV